MMKLLFTKRTVFRFGFLSVFFLIGSVVFAQNSNQKITIKAQDITVKEFLKQIEIKTAFTVVYRDILVDDKKDITVNANNKPLTDVLKIVLTPKDLQAVFNNNTIVITKKNVEPQITNKTKIVSGVVLDEKGQPVIGASIIIPGTTIGVATDINGRFTLEAPSNAKLRISYIGYDAKEELLSAGSDLKIKLDPTPQILKELVITAQAIGQKNAIQQQINSNTLKNVVAADRLQENPDANATEAIGRLPGISVQRIGGEGVGLVIRGLEPRYSSVTLNGIELPATGGSDRSTNLSGISQYALQGAEVFKSLTADMDANSVAGSVNLKLREAPKDLHINLMAQKGYNQLNNDWGNYKFLTEASNRFFDNKLGVLFTASAEKVNRSVQTMSSGYTIESSNPNADILLVNTNLNINSSFIYRQTAMLSLDYKVSPNTTLMLYGMYNRSKNDRSSQSKNYGTTNSGYVGYNFGSSPNAETNIFQTSISGESKFKFLNIKADYGLSFSNGQNDNLGERSWNFAFNNSSTSSIVDYEHRKLDPSVLIPLFTDTPDRLLDCRLNAIGMSDSRINDKNINTFLNISIPYKVGDFITAFIKFGGLYKSKSRFRDDTVGSQFFGVNQFAPKILADTLNWIVLDDMYITAKGLTDGNVDNFLNGKYNYGNTFSFDKLNQISDAWENISNYYYAQGPSAYLPKFGDVTKIGYTQNVGGCILNDQNIKQNYGAGYIMSEINFGRYVMLLPGIRYESTHTTMKGFYATPPQYVPPINAPVPGKDTSAVNSNQFLLPMVHLRIKPTDSFYMHFAYTQTLSRPDFNSISPTYYVNSGLNPLFYISSNPNLKPELWSSYDAQFVLHSKKIGLLSVNAFYKSVKDKIWRRNYKRIKGDPIINPFPNTATVDVTAWENHSYPGYVNGLEFEWQTSFFYLPKPFNYFTMTANYTFTHSQTTYPYTRLETKVPEGGGRPTIVRVDSTITGRLLNQPTHVANVSLGFNKGGFNAWLSFQYNGQIYTGINYMGVPRLNSEKDYFYRWDLQITQKFKIRDIHGFEVLLNIANISNYNETQKLSGDIRNTYIEQYGVTGDLGLRFKF